MAPSDDLIGEPPKRLRQLNPAQAKFVEEFLATGNKSEAARAAGYSEEYAGERGYQAANTPVVAEAIREGRAKMMANLLITPERVMAEYRKIAFCDVRKLTDDTGAPIAIHKLDDETAGAIAGLDVASTDVGGNVTSKVTKYKLSDKRAALDALAKLLDLTPEKIDVNVTGTMEVTRSNNDIARRIAFVLSQAVVK